MASITQEQYRALLPLACEWAEDQERLILQNGICLTHSQMEDAKLVGVSNPEKVKLLEIPYIPLPEHPALKAAAEATHLITPDTKGLTLRYGIFIRSDCWDSRRLLVHELAHTAQYERLGGFSPFLERYLMECITIGYPAAPMEQEAIRIENAICS